MKKDIYISHARKVYLFFCFFAIFFKKHEFGKTEAFTQILPISYLRSAPYQVRAQMRSTFIFPKNPSPFPITDTENGQVKITLRIAFLEIK